MKTKKILSFVCVLALVLTMCSAFTFATQPEAEAEIVSEITPRYTGYGTVNRDSRLYKSYSTSSGYAYNGIIHPSTRVYIYSLVTSNGVQFYRVNVQISGSSHTGYILKSHVTTD